MEINAENFPDENFRYWVHTYLQDNKFQYVGTDGVLTEEEIASILEMDVTGSNIQDMKGIEYFTALKWLSCSNNQLTTLDVSKNTALTLLYSYGNQLTALDLSGSTALTTLQCGNNKLTSLNVFECPALQTLSCEINQLTSLDVSKNTALTGLSCRNNRLTTLDVSQNTALTWLYCYQNQIKGAGMDALVESLPTGTDGYLNVIYNEDEQNIMTTTQVAVAKAKGWTPQYTTGEVDYLGYLIWKEYAGIEDPDGILSMDNGKLTMDNYYDLNGRRFNNGQLKMDNGQLKPGIYIVNGKKVVIK